MLLQQYARFQRQYRIPVFQTVCLGFSGAETVPYRMDGVL